METFSQTSPAARSEASAQSLLAQQLNSQLPPGTPPRAALASLPPTQPGLVGADTAAGGVQSSSTQSPSVRPCAWAPPARAGTSPNGSCSRGRIHGGASLSESHLNLPKHAPSHLPPFQMPTARGMRASNAALTTPWRAVGRESAPLPAYTSDGFGPPLFTLHCSAEHCHSDTAACAQSFNSGQIN